MKKNSSTNLIVVFLSLGLIFLILSCSSSSSDSDGDGDSSSTGDGTSFSSPLTMTSASDLTKLPIKSGQTVYYSMGGFTEDVSYDFSLTNRSPYDSNTTLKMLDSEGEEVAGACFSRSHCTWTADSSGMAYLKVDCSSDGTSIDGIWEKRYGTDYDAISIYQGNYVGCKEDYLISPSSTGTIDTRTITTVGFTESSDVFTGSDASFDMLLYIGEKTSSYEYIPVSSAWNSGDYGCQDPLTSSHAIPASDTSTDSSSDAGYFDEEGAWHYYVRYDLEVPTVFDESSYNCSDSSTYTSIPETYTQSHPQCQSACMEYVNGDFSGAKAYCTILDGYYNADMLDPTTQICSPCLQKEVKQASSD